MILLFNQILSMMPQSAGYFRAQVSLWDFPVCIMEMISKKNMPNGSHLLQLHKCNGCSPLILSPNKTIAHY